MFNFVCSNNKLVFKKQFCIFQTKTSFGLKKCLLFLNYFLANKPFKLKINNFNLSIKFRFWARNLGLSLKYMQEYLKPLLYIFFFESFVFFPMTQHSIVTQKSPHVNGRAKKSYTKTYLDYLVLTKCYTFYNFFHIFLLLKSKYNAYFFWKNPILVTNSYLTN